MNELQVIEYREQRVLTTQQLAEVYETDAKNIQMNFANNKSRFNEGKHYHILNGEELKLFKKSLPNDIGEPLKFVPQLILWTERGANFHSKILDTDKAWEQFEYIEEAYFQVKQQTTPLSTMGLLELQYRALIETNEKIATIDRDVHQLKDNAPLNPGEYNLVNTKVAERVRTIKHERGMDLTREQNSELYKAINREIKVITGVHTRSQLRQKHLDGVLDFVRDWEPSKATMVVISQMHADI